MAACSPGRPPCNSRWTATLLALGSVNGFAQPALEQRHLEFHGSAYQDYKGLKGPTIHAKAVRLLRTKSFRAPAFDAAAAAVTREHDGQRCVAGQDSPEPAASRCRAFRAYNPSVLVPEVGGGVLLLARLSNWSLCSWNGQGRPYADWPDRRWPEAVYEEYHSHLASLELADAELAGALVPGPAPAAGLTALDGGAWARTRAPFFEIFRQGLEDPRLLLLRGRPHALAAYGQRSARREATRLADSRVERAGAFRQALVALQKTPGGGYTVAAEGFTPLSTDFDRYSQQKNWMPFVHKGVVHVIYQLVPSMKVLEVDETLGSATVVHESAPDPALSALGRAEVRGGSQCVHLAERQLYIGVAHVSRGRAMYTHFFFAFADTPPFGMLGVSREWCLAHEETFESGKELLCEGVQFVSGLALAPAVDGEGNASLLLSYGVMDCDARLARVPLERAVRSIRFRGGRHGPGPGAAPRGSEL